MRRWIGSLLQDFLNAGLDPEAAAPEDLRRVRNLTMATLGFSALALPVVLTNTLAFGPRFGLALIFALLAAHANVAWLRRSRDLERAGHVATSVLFSYLAFAMWFGGGIAEPVFASFYLVPLTAALLVDARAAARWAGACVLAAVAFFAAGRQGILPESLLTGELREAHLLLGHAVAVLGVGILASAFARNHDRLQARLRSANEQLGRESDYVQVLHRSAVIANDAGSSEEALRRSVELVCTGLDWDLGTVWVPDAAGGLALLGGHERDPLRDADLRRTLCDRPLLAGQSLAGRAPVASEDVSTDERLPGRDAARAAGLRGAFAFPLVMAGEVVAVFEFFRREQRGPERELLRLLAHVGTQVSRVMERERAEARIENLAYYDTLTGLPNRQLFQERLDDALRHARDRECRAALLFVDLDGFKRVNDTLGHAVGDGLLREVTRRFAQSVRLTDVIGRGEGNDEAVSRLGGDEFTVLLGKVGDRAGAAAAAERLLAALQTPVEIDGHEIFAGASIGIAIYPDDGEDPDALLRHADAAMYLAKGRGRGQFQFYTDEESCAGSRRLEIEGPLRRALQNDQFELHYQPLVDMAGGDTVGAEALLRWHEPSLGNVSPAEFIPLAEQCGLINRIGEWIIRAACAQIHQWIEEGFAPVRVAVNVSGQQIRGPALVECVAGALQENGLEPELLELEITESTIMRDDDLTSSTLKALSQLGVGIVLDDFGTGYSSLSHLRRHPIDSLKLDQTFVSGLPDDPDDAAIATAVVAMAHGLHKRVTAEGIETEAQLAFLRRTGCDLAQGYLFSRAVPGADFVRFLRREKPDAR